MTVRWINEARYTVATDDDGGMIFLQENRQMFDGSGSLWTNSDDVPTDELSTWRSSLSMYIYTYIALSPHVATEYDRSYFDGIGNWKHSIRSPPPQTTLGTCLYLLKPTHSQKAIHIEFPTGRAEIPCRLLHGECPERFFPLIFVTDYRTRQ